MRHRKGIFDINLLLIQSWKRKETKEAYGAREKFIILEMKMKEAKMDKTQTYDAHLLYFLS